MSKYKGTTGKAQNNTAIISCFVENRFLSIPVKRVKKFFLRLNFTVCK